jgi:hypothetical protein
MPLRATLAIALLAAFPLTQMAAQPDDKASAAVEKIIVPFVNKHCVQCHGPQKKKADLALHVYRDEKSMLKDRKKWHSVMQMVHSGEMPPEKQPRPDVKDTEIFLKAIADVFAVADKSGKRDPGRVTMRRLNRAEYNNTVRDLLGVDFKPADDFPSDDVGYGFDNIGDVLTISPLLMERYLAAAETIVGHAIVVGEPAKPPVRSMSARFLEPAVKNPEAVGKFRPITSNKSGLSTVFLLTQEGEFKMRVRGYGKQVGSEPVKIALLVNGKQQQTFDVKVKDPASTKDFEIKMDFKSGLGSVRVAVQLLNEYKQPDGKDKGMERAFVVEKIQLEGPLDTRPLSHRKIMAHAEGLAPREAAREIFTRFASAAYRRPAGKDEVERLLKFVDQAQKNGERWESGIQLALQAVLCSPKFLFRVELDDRPDSAGAHPLDEYQLASRLSYFLWSSMPDEELFALAAKKQLHQNLDMQAVRMLRDPKSRALVENFAAQWLQIRLLKNLAPDRKLFPDFDESLRAAMATETELFFGAVVAEDRSILEFVDSKFSFMNERLARHYGIADTNGNRLYQKATAKPGQKIKGKSFVRVTFADDERGGILTQASILAVTSNPTRTSPVKRGRWILEQILGTPPPPPPPNVPELEEKGELRGSLRERMEQHRKNASCASCHARMDPIGFAFENYDALGKFRTKDGGFPIDTSGTLPGGQSFKGPRELKQVLLQKKDLFSRALTEKMLTYAIGRGLEYYDRASVDRIVTVLSRNDFRFSYLMVEITKSDPFRLRRGKDQKSE